MSTSSVGCAGSCCLARTARRDNQPVAIPLRDLAEGNPHRQRQLVSTGD